MCLENRQVEEDKEQMQSSSERMLMGEKNESGKAIYTFIALMQKYLFDR